MSDDLYERYKATLRAGHVHLLRGSLDEAAAEYRTAAEIAPSRAMPHTSLGGVYMRLGHLQDALTEYAEAVALAPADEGALLGWAEALSVAGQRVDAASALDRVAQVQETSARLPEAADTLRRALEFEDTVERLQHHRALLRQIRLSDGDQAAEQLLARALRLREEPPAPAARGRRVRTDELVAELTRLAEPAEGASPESSAAEPLPDALDAEIGAEPVEAIAEAAAWSVEDETVEPEAAAAVERVVVPGLPAAESVADLEVEQGAEIEDMESIDSTTLEEALALRMEALAGDLDMIGLATVEAELAPEAGLFPEPVPEACAGVDPERAPEVEVAAQPEPEPAPESAAEEAAPVDSERPAASAATLQAGPSVEPPAVPSVEAIAAAHETWESSDLDGKMPGPAAEAEPELAPAGPSTDSESFALPDEVEPPVVAVMAVDRAAAARGGAEVQLQPTGDELLAAAEAAEASGDLKNLRSLLVWTARAYAREGRFDAALDAAHRLLQRYPGDVDAHLVLVELYVARDWDVLAVEKLGLLDRLARLGDDEATHDRLRAVAARAFPSDPRVDGILGDQGAAAGGA